VPRLQEISNEAVAGHRRRVGHYAGCRLGHPHHDPATNLSHSHVGEVAIFALIGIVAFVAWRRVVPTNRNRRD
jgi:hypothetical protein